MVYARLGDLEYADAIFDADPAFYRRWSLSDLRHPAVAALFLPLQALARIAEVVWNVDRIAAERTMGLLVPPMVQAALAVIVAMLGRRLIGSQYATALAVLVFVSAANVTIGVIPESYALSATAIAAALLLGTYPFSRQTIPWWLAAGAFAGAVTSTNLVLISAVLWTSLLVVDRRRIVDATRVAGVMAIGMALGLIGLIVVSAVRMETRGLYHLPGTSWTAPGGPDFMAPRRYAYWRELPVSIATAVVAPFQANEMPRDDIRAFWDAMAIGRVPEPPRILPPGTFATRPPLRRQRAVTMAGLDIRASAVASVTAILLVAVVFGARTLSASSVSGRFVVLAGVGVLLLSAVFIWCRHGLDFFLFTPFWLVPEALALAGLAFRFPPRWQARVLWSIVATTAVVSARLVLQIVGR